MIPLDTRTRLSLYSFVDLTFCITCPAKPIRAKSKRRWLLGAASGTSIFVFKVKSRTRAMDWVWHLWYESYIFGTRRIHIYSCSFPTYRRHLGGRIPKFLEIKAPFLDTRFKIDIPAYNSGNITKAYSTFTRANIISLCETGLRDVPAYKTLIEENKDKGIELELAWRIDTYLDWIWTVEDGEGKVRDWAVLIGLALKQVGSITFLTFDGNLDIIVRLTNKTIWNFVFIGIDQPVCILKMELVWTNQQLLRVTWIEFALTLK